VGEKGFGERSPAKRFQLDFEEQKAQFPEDVPSSLTFLGLCFLFHLKYEYIS